MSEEPNLREQTDHHAVALISGEDACGAMARLFMPRQSESPCRSRQSSCPRCKSAYRSPAARICSQRAFLQATRCGRTKVDTFLRPHKALQNQRKRPFADIGPISESACCRRLSRRSCPTLDYNSKRAFRFCTCERTEHQNTGNESRLGIPNHSFFLNSEPIAKQGTM